MFLLPFKGREQRGLSAPRQAAGEGTAAVLGPRPSSPTHPCERPTTPPPALQERQPGLSQPPPAPCPGCLGGPSGPAPPEPPPPHSCPRPEGKCVGGRGMGWGPAGERAALHVVPARLGMCVSEGLWVLQCGHGVRGGPPSGESPVSSGHEAVPLFIRSFVHSFKQSILSCHHGSRPARTGRHHPLM